MQRASTCRGSGVNQLVHANAPKVLEFIYVMEFSIVSSAMSFGAIGAAPTHTLTCCVAFHDIVSSEMHAYLLL